MKQLAIILVWLIAFVVASQAAALAAEATKEALWGAAKKGDAAEVERLLAAGVDVNAHTDYNVTALFYAAEKGHLDVVRVLIARKADLNAADTFYKSTPLRMAAGNKHAAVVRELLEQGASGGETVLPSLATWADADLVRAAIEKSKPTDAILTQALKAAKERPEIVQVLEAAGAAIPIV